MLIKFFALFVASNLGVNRCARSCVWIDLLNRTADSSGVKSRELTDIEVFFNFATNQFFIISRSFLSFLIWVPGDVVYYSHFCARQVFNIKLKLE